MPAPRILLVDDAADVGLIVRRLGQRAGQEVEVRPTAEAAWEYLAAQRPDLAILDFHLPGASGCDLCRRIRGLPPLADLPVAMLGQAERPEDLAAGLDAGADYLICKELLTQPDGWRQRLEEILGERPAAPALPEPPPDRCRDLCRQLQRQLDERLLSAILRRISPPTAAAAASNLAAWESAERLQVLFQHLERVLGSYWCAPWRPGER